VRNRSGRPLFSGEGTQEERGGGLHRRDKGERDGDLGRTSKEFAKGQGGERYEGGGVASILSAIRRPERKASRETRKTSSLDRLLREYIGGESRGKGDAYPELLQVKERWKKDRESKIEALPRA